MSNDHAAHTAAPAPWPLLEALGDGVYAVDLAGNCTFINKSALRSLGYDQAADLLGHNMHASIHHTRPDGSSFPQAECPLLHTTISGLPVRLENEMLWRRNRTPFFAEYSSYPVIVDAKTVGSVITFSESSVRQDSRRRLAVQYAIGQILAGAATEEALPARVLEAVGTGFDWELGRFWRLETHPDRGESLNCICAWQSSDLDSLACLSGSATSSPGEALAARACRMGTPIHAAELSENERSVPSMTNGFAFPLLDGPAVLGAIDFQSRHRIETDESLLEATTTLGQMVGQALERRRIARELSESEHLKQAILGSSPDCIIAMDADGRILEFNQAAERTFGRTAAESLGRELGAMIFPADSLPIYRRIFSALLDTKQTSASRRIEIDAVDANANRFPIECIIAPTQPGARPLFTAHLRDISARRGEQARLRQSEARFRTIANTIPQLSWMTDANGSVTWFNQRWYDYIGPDAADMRGWGWKSVHHPDHIERVERHLRQSFATGSDWEDTFPLRSKDGVFNWFLSRALPIREEPDAEFPEGRILGWFGTNTDVTAMREVEHTLEAARDDAEAANRAKSIFIANMSHELRTPLSAIIGISEMLGEEIEDGVASGDLAEDVRKIERNARHLLGLINNVLDLSKVESGKMEAFAETFDVAAMARDVVATVGTLMEKKNNRLALNLSDGLGTMHSDITRVRQILFNLLSNAAKFTEDGFVTLSLEPSQNGDGKEFVVFSVRDSGIGMTPAQIGKLFHRFQQADASTTRQYGGTGLGLALTKGFATLLGGTITVDSVPGGGCNFVVRLPARLASAGSLTVSDAQADPAGRDIVLVVDDDETQRELMSRFLVREGYAARCASDGPGGLVLARQLQPRAILLDVTMPGMDGWSVLSALKADPALARIPVVMVTFASERALASSLGAADYVVKPVEWERLRHVMERFRDAEGDVLVVDDEADTRTRTRLVLEKNGWSVVEAANGLEALESVSRAIPQVILLDLNMPEMDGFAFLHALRARPGFEAIPVVVLTGLDLTAEDRRRLRGANQILNKGDVSLRDLADKLRQLGAGAVAGSRSIRAQAWPNR